jgi:soluble lytic murein transglycosylase-like protein
MRKSIPSRDQLYFDENCFRIKNPRFKKFKIGLLVGFSVGFLLFSTADEAAITENEARITESASPPTKQIALIKHVSEYNRKDAQDIVESAYKWGEHFEVDPLMILAIAKTESHFDKHAISSAGAMGVMQILTKWHIDKMMVAKNLLGNPSPFDIDTNIFMGAWVFKDCRSKNKSVESQLQCYNGSTDKNNKYDSKVLNNLHSLKKV